MRRLFNPSLKEEGLSMTFTEKMLVVSLVCSLVTLGCVIAGFFR